MRPWFYVHDQQHKQGKHGYPVQSIQDNRLEFLFSSCQKLASLKHHKRKFLYYEHKVFRIGPLD